jgi:hypothetical protein
MLATGDGDSSVIHLDPYGIPNHRRAIILRNTHDQVRGVPIATQLVRADREGALVAAGVARLATILETRGRLCGRRFARRGELEAASQQNGRCEKTK